MVRPALREPERRPMASIWLAATAAASLALAGAAKAESTAPEKPAPAARAHAKARAKPAAASAPTPAGHSLAELKVAPRMGAWGFDAAGRDLGVSPARDFYQ